MSKSKRTSLATAQRRSLIIARYSCSLVLELLQTPAHLAIERFKRKDSGGWWVTSCAGLQLKHYSNKLVTIETGEGDSTKRRVTVSSRRLLNDYAAEGGKQRSVDYLYDWKEKKSKE